MKRIGPELKMPKFKGGDTKVPPFLADLYYDIRDRRLLPLILLILVAIVAAPVLLKDEPEEVAPATPPAAVNPGAEQASKTLTVVKSAPGLRDYKERLKRRQPSNPFKQQYTGAASGGGELNEATTTTTETSESIEGGSSGGSDNPSSGGGEYTVKPGQLTIFTFAVNVRISKARTKPSGAVEQSKPEDRERVIAPKPLPSAQEPVVTYMGIGGEKHLPLFLVSKNVTAVFGEAECVSGTDLCQLIELEPGQPEIFEYGENHVRYKINVLKVFPVVTGKS